MKTIAIVQARLGSTRFPKKVLRKVLGKTLIEILLLRLSKSKFIDKIIVATTTEPIDDDLYDHIVSLGYECFRGSENDVLDRYYQAALIYKPKNIVRITGDCPLIDVSVVDKTIDLFYKNKVDYCSNRIIESFPNGTDVEIFTFKSLCEIQFSEKNIVYREHVTATLYNSKKFKTLNYLSPKNLNYLRLTVDYIEDFELIDYILTHSKNIFITLDEIILLYKNNPKPFLKNIELNNLHLPLDDNMTGQKLYYRAKKIIPGGTSLFSKRPELFLPNRWPVYYSKAKGCHVWDLDNIKFIDLSFMGVGTNVLGYANNEVDSAVINSIKQGNMTTLNCKEEVLLAERLINIHKWADMARFTRSGGEANAMAIRIARISAKSKNVAFCGYHGWHDWYLSANLNDTGNLEGHAVKDIKSKGVPTNIKNTAFPFIYNNINQLEYLIENHDIGIIKMEVMRNINPKDNFLKKVRDLATKNNIILIFDECSSGFRETFGGLHKKFNVDPDMAIFGKAIGNGYAINSVIGKREIMDQAQDSFISSTFWTERSGFVAALKTIEIMERIKSWEIVSNISNLIKDRLLIIAEKNKINIEIYGTLGILSFKFNSPLEKKYKTFITQEMLYKRILASTTIYVSIMHNQKILEKYFTILDKIFAIIKKCEDGDDIDKYLKNEVCIDTFSRLN